MLDALCEDQRVSWTVMEDMLTLERAVHHRCTPAQLALTERQRFNRQNRADLLQDLVAATTMPTSPMCGLKSETTTFTSSRFPPGYRSLFSSSRILGGVTFLRTLALADLPAAIAKILASDVLADARYAPG